MFTDFLKTSFFILSLVLFTSLLGSSSVNAQSVYDDVIEIEPYPYIEDRDNSKVNVSTVWAGLFDHNEILIDEVGLNGYMGSPCSFDVNTATAWTLVQDEQNGVKLIWSEESNPEPLNFYTMSGYNFLQPNDYEGTPFGICYMKKYNNLLWTTDFGYGITDPPDTTALYMVAQSDNPSYNVKPIFINWDVNYPAGYQGAVPPDSIEDEFEHKIGVSIRGSVAEDIVQVEWYEDRDNPKPDNAKGMFLTLGNPNFDEFPPECSNQNMQMWRGSLEDIVNFNPVPCYGMWYVNSYYTSDEQGQNIIPNTDKTALNLMIDGTYYTFDYVDVEYGEDGSIISPPIGNVGFNDCFSVDDIPPYISVDINGCFENVGIFFGFAKNTSTQFSSQFNNVTIEAKAGCGSMNHINEWIHLDDTSNVLCPQMKEEIRFFATTFVVFLLWIGALYVVTRAFMGIH